MEKTKTKFKKVTIDSEKALEYTTTTVSVERKFEKDLIERKKRMIAKKAEVDVFIAEIDELLGKFNK
jgi:hypothetical protein